MKRRTEKKGQQSKLNQRRNSPIMSLKGTSAPAPSIDKSAAKGKESREGTSERMNKKVHFEDKMHTRFD